MDPRDLRPGDTVLTRHIQSRGDRLPVITETTLELEQVLPRDQMVIGKPLRRFVYIQGNPAGGQQVPARGSEAAHFGDLVTVQARGRQDPQPVDRLPDVPTARVQISLTLDCYLAGNSPERARAALKEVAQAAPARGLLAFGFPDARVVSCSVEIDGTPAMNYPDSPSYTEDSDRDRGERQR
ncbi:hypothetical protein [Ramlibacter sp. AN1133]|uniref:hypothetical protein n=1 Tax=Ramlibacter sp. AN1133 TaxID=3133429 RepID=UPI0030BA5398